MPCDSQLHTADDRSYPPVRKKGRSRIRLPDVATTCNNLAMLLKNQHRPEEAERLYREALEIRRRLAKEDPDAFLPEKSDTAFNLAILMYNVKRDLSASRMLFDEALEGYSQFAHLTEEADKVQKILKEWF